MNAKVCLFAPNYHERSDNMFPVFGVDDIIRLEADERTTTLYLTLHRTSWTEANPILLSVILIPFCKKLINYSVLKVIQLQVPCNTWSQEHARANFGVDEGKT